MRQSQSLLSSVARWLEYLSKIWQFRARKFCPNSINNFAKVGCTLSNTKYFFQISKDFLTFCQSGKISPNLVTLLLLGKNVPGGGSKKMWSQFWKFFDPDEIGKKTRFKCYTTFKLIEQRHKRITKIGKQHSNSS